MTDQPRRDGGGAGTPFPTSDYTGVPAISIMIGTNDSDGSSFGNISDIPAGSVHDYTDHNEYFQLFPNNFTANIALCIEYVQWKNPETEIHLITPPYRHNEAAGTQRITKLIPFLEAVARHYEVHLIYATYESGISYKGMHPTQGAYTYDGIHFNEVGNRVFGKFIAQKILSFG